MKFHEFQLFLAVHFSGRLKIICNDNFCYTLCLHCSLDLKLCVWRVRDRPAHVDQVCRRSVTPKTNTKWLYERRKRKHPNPLSRNGCKSVFPRCDVCVLRKSFNNSNVEVGRHGSADEVHWKDRPARVSSVCDWRKLWQNRYNEQSHSRNLEWGQFRTNAQIRMLRWKFHAKDRNSSINRTLRFLLVQT